MKSNIFRHLSENVLISFFIVLPQLIVAPDVQQFLLLLLLSVFLILLSTLQRHIFAFFVILVGIFDLIESNIALHWGGYNGALSSRIAVSLQSPMYETIEYIHNYIDLYDLGVSIYILSIFFWMFLSLKKISMKTTYFTITLLFAILLFAILQNQEPFKSVKEFFRSAQRGKIIKTRKEFLHQHNTTIQKQQKGIYDTVVLIQGEAANKHHMQIYGYTKETTPFLSSLEKETGFYKFNAIAPSNQTRYSIPMFYTEANVTHWQEGFIKSASIFKIFSLHDYTTYWLSNQGKIGKWNDFITSIAEETTYQSFFNTNDYVEPKKDIVITNYLHTHTFKNNKSVFLLHLLGSHVDYSKRYEKDHVLFKDAHSVLEKYDNTIFYTDYILQQIFHYFRQTKEKILIVYFSDHGEIVSEDIYGHGRLPPHKDEYDIPFVLYSSIPNPRIEELYKTNQKHYFNLENLNKIILDITGISNHTYTSTSSQVFALSPKHLFNYEKLPFLKKTYKENNE